VKQRKRKRQEEIGDVVGEEQVEKVVEEFGKRREGTKLQLDKEPWCVTVEFKSTDGTSLHFEISRSTREDDNSLYEVLGPRIPDNVTKGERKLLQAVQRCLSKRARQNSLEHTLGTVAAYKDLREAKCEVCHRIINSEGAFPAARKSKRVKTEGGEETKWVALHEDCAEGEKTGIA
jgi:hypothetical protein